MITVYASSVASYDRDDIAVKMHGFRAQIDEMHRLYCEIPENMDNVVCERWFAKKGRKRSDGTAYKVDDDTPPPPDLVEAMHINFCKVPENKGSRLCVIHFEHQEKKKAEGQSGGEL